MNDSADGRGGRTPGESAASREHFVKHSPKRENIGARVGRLSLGLLWRHVCRSAHDRTHLGDAHGLGFVFRQAAMTLFRESEIQQLYNAAGGCEDVRRFEVAMNDPFAMRGFERGSDLPGEPQSLSRRKSLRLLTINNRQPVNILHDQIIRADIVNLADVGMIQRGNGFGFTLETLAERGM